jgi:hypothetical protein
MIQLEHCSAIPAAMRSHEQARLYKAASRRRAYLSPTILREMCASVPAFRQSAVSTESSYVSIALSARRGTCSAHNEAATSGRVENSIKTSCQGRDRSHQHA